MRAIPCLSIAVLMTGISSSIAVSEDYPCNPVDDYGRPCFKVVYSNQELNGIYMAYRVQNNCNRLIFYNAYYNFSQYDGKGYTKWSVGPNRADGSYCDRKLCGGYQRFEPLCKYGSKEPVAPKAQDQPKPPGAANPSSSPLPRPAVMPKSRPDVDISTVRDNCRRRVENVTVPPFSCNLSSGSLDIEIAKAEMSAGAGLRTQPQLLRKRREWRTACEASITKSVYAECVADSLGRRDPDADRELASITAFRDDLWPRLLGIAAAWSKGDNSLLAREGLSPSPKGPQPARNPMESAERMGVTARKVAEPPRRIYERCIPIEFYASATNCPARGAMCTSDNRTYVCVKEAEILSVCPAWGNRGRSCKR